MTIETTLCRQLTFCNVVCLAVALSILSGCAAEPPTLVQEQRLTIPTMANFCADRQQALTNSRVTANNVVYDDYAAFAKSKPSIRPLETEQYVHYLDAGRTQPGMISCKFKTSDHIRAEYGASAAGEPATCAFLNRRTLDALLASMSERQRRKLLFRGGTAVLIEADIVATQGPEWLQPFEMVRTDLAGTLHIVAKVMRNDWTDPKLADVPARFKGTHYCQLIAPDYLQRLLTGKAKVP